jgi:hypothetical protein
MFLFLIFPLYHMGRFLYSLYLSLLSFPKPHPFVDVSVIILKGSGLSLVYLE